MAVKTRARSSTEYEAEAQEPRAGPSLSKASPNRASNDICIAASTSAVADGDSDDSDSDAAPEEESNTASRSVVRANDEQRRAEVRKKQEARKKAAASRQQRNEKQKSASKGPAQKATGDQAAQSSASDAVKGPATDNDDSDVTAAAAEELPDRLDPALFASAFAAPARPASILKATRTDDDVEDPANVRGKSALARAAEKRHREKRRGGIVRGRDGQPMRRVDASTTVRVLETGPREDEESQRPREEVLRKPAAVHDVEAGPNARARAFKKRRLGLKGTQAGSNASSRVLGPKTSAKKSKKSAFDEDDPLGLEDPAFMKGGEFEGVGLSAGGKKKRSRSRGGEKKSFTELRGADAGRRKGALPISRNGGVIQFVHQ